MKLYHGTSSRFLKDILEKGLQPRRKGKGNWKQYPSRSDMVYLTTAYPFYFAMGTKEDGELCLVIEIDSDRLDQELFYPDEDFVSQAIGGSEGYQSIHSSIKKNLNKYRHHWKLSIENLGNCCYKGVVPSEAITRYCLFDSKQRSQLSFCMLDPTISILNYKIIGKHKYTNLVQWMFGDTPKLLSDFEIFKIQNAVEVDNAIQTNIAFWDKESHDRTGITIVKN
jgi:hypothetical protein